MEQRAELQILKNRREEFFSHWVNTVESQDHFKSIEFFKTPKFHESAYAFIDILFSAYDQNKIPSFPDESIEPLFSFWKHTKKTFMSRGMSLKDIALLIMSFKTTLKDIHLIDFDQETEQRLSHLLDFLGLLTFEQYSQKNEQMISSQAQKIGQLQRKSNQISISSQSPAMTSVFKSIGLVLDNDISVLLRGESGVGKDFIASLIHNHSHRKDAPFVAINCAAIPKDLIESELFGHEKGAFTGANEKKIGKFELAQNGTLFLDEIGELNMDLQVKLLRVLQNKCFERVGGKDTIQMTARLITATNKDLEAAIQDKTFRLDLFYRINVFPIAIPSLRNRQEDIVSLSEFFLEKYAKEFKIPRPTIDDQALTYLKSYSWPGNIRELENLMQRSVLLASGGQITEEILNFQPGQTQNTLMIESTVEEIRSLESIEKDAIFNAIKSTNGNVMKAAKALGITRTTLYNKAKKYQIPLDESRF